MKIKYQRYITVEIVTNCFQMTDGLSTSIALSFNEVLSKWCQSRACHNIIERNFLLNLLSTFTDST